MLKVFSWGDLVLFLVQCTACLWLAPEDWPRGLGICALLLAAYLAGKYLSRDRESC